jgi:hypothetical protein
MRFCTNEELQREVGLEHIMLWSTHPGVAHARSMNSLRLFSEQVKPQFIKQPALAGTK